jgi:transposase
VNLYPLPCNPVPATHLIRHRDVLSALRSRSDTRTDSTHILASVRNINRGELVGEALRSVLNAFSTVYPNWVASNVDASWYMKYAKRFESSRMPHTKDEIVASAEDVGRDGIALLETLWSDQAPGYLRCIPAVATLRQCWVTQFWTDNGILRWRHAGNLPPSPARIDSPYDREARYGIMR